jgi:anti-anti-sigma regulatory factor
MLWLGEVGTVSTLLFEIRKGRRPDGTVGAFARMTGTLDAGNLAHFRKIISRLTRNDVRDIVLDLSGVTRVDLKGLGAIQETEELLETLGGSLRVTGTELDDTRGFPED